jgi:uncharacterized membrane protein
MKSLFKFGGLISGTMGAIMIVLGFIGFFTGEILNVRDYSNFFWFANPFLMLGIFGLVASIACKGKEKH